ncbi:MAG TPA: hypothetical protein PLO51_03745 [Candidatus Micrarchaeota archaeon]|nr:hypothetical protein [Candidatus Micrarchaeota archaeon]
MEFLKHANIDFRFVFAIMALVMLVSNVAVAMPTVSATGISADAVNITPILVMPYVYLNSLSLNSEFQQGDPIYLSATLVNMRNVQQDITVTLRISGNQIIYGTTGTVASSGSGTSVQASSGSEQEAEAADSGKVQEIKADSEQIQASGQALIAQKGSDARTYYVSQTYTLAPNEKRLVEFKVSEDNLPYTDTIGVGCAYQYPMATSTSGSANSAVAIIDRPICANYQYKAYTIRLMAAQGTNPVYAPGAFGSAIIGSFTVRMADNSSDTTKVVAQGLEQGWNLVSAPTQPYGSIDYSDCQAVSPFWAYNPATSQYEKADMPSYANGYWIYTQNKCTLKYIVPQGIAGMPNPNAPYHMQAGWNLVGNPFRYLSSNPSAGQLTGCTITSGPWNYDTANQKYVQADSLSDGKGAWIKVAGDCDLAYNGGNNPPAPPQ